MRFRKTNKLTFGAVAGLVLATGAIAFAQSTTTTITESDSSQGSGQDIRVTVNHQPIDFQGPGPVMVDGSVMVPVRGVFEQMGGQVQWMPRGKVVEGSRPGHMFRLRLGEDQAVVDGNSEYLSTPPQLIDETTYIPLRFASEALGAHVAWHGRDRTVSITTDEPMTIIRKTTTTTTTSP